MCVPSKFKVILTQQMEVKQNSLRSKKRLIPNSVVMKVQRSNAYIVTSDSAQTKKCHVTYQVKAQLIIYIMVCVLCSESKCNQSYGSLTMVGVKKLLQKE